MFLSIVMPVLLPAQQVSDIDGNNYSTIRIGTQEWMTENLRTTRFNDGTSIPLVTSDIIWEGLEGPGYCWYDHSRLMYEVPYGILYNWYTLDPETNGEKNVCPLGWHVPTDTEWKALEDFLDEGHNMPGEKMKSDALWSLPENPVITIRRSVERNSSGFNGLPGGMRDQLGRFWGLSYYGFWWSSTRSNDKSAKARGLIYNANAVSTFSGRNKKHGLSVRCVKD